MRTYIGKGHAATKVGDCQIEVWERQTSDDLRFVGMLTHIAIHSPTGFEWGYSGSGPTDLARSLLWDLLGHEPSTEITFAFKRDFVEGWPMHAGECWRITTHELSHWLERTLNDQESYVR